jgi:catechol 2,3-dioxygenase-like lactoylglutathione lyase family enzyme
MIKIRHIGITVTDAEKSLKLYRDYLGLEVVWDKIEEGEFIDGLSGISNIKVRTIKLKSDEGMIELLQYMSHPRNNIQNINNNIFEIGCSHFALTINNLDKIYSDLLELDLKFNKKPQRSPDGKAKVCFCRDYDGTLIELVEELK